MTVAKRNRVTLGDVAKAANVSRSTASRALNNSPRISRETTARIKKIADSMGFIPNAQGRALAVGRNETIAILITEPLDELFDDPTYAMFISGITEKLSESSYLPVLLQASTDFERHRVQQHLERRSFDAVIDISPYANNYLLEEMYKLRIPCVMLGQMEDRSYEGIFSSVYSDDTYGAQIAAQAMHDAGRRHPISILGPRSNPASPDRLTGYRRVCGDELPDDRVLFTGWDATAGFSAMMQLLDTHDDIDGLLAGSDRIAVGAIEAIRQRGLTVPDDIAVVGFDDHPIAERCNPPLTTVQQPLREEGSTAADLAMRMIDGEAATTVIKHMTLVRRKSL